MSNPEQSNVRVLTALLAVAVLCLLIYLGLKP